MKYDHPDEEVRIIVSRRWVDEFGDPISWVDEAATEWMQSDDVDLLTDRAMGVVVRHLLDVTRADNESQGDQGQGEQGQGEQVEST